MTRSIAMLVILRFFALILSWSHKSACRMCVEQPVCACIFHTVFALAVYKRIAVFKSSSSSGSRRRGIAQSDLTIGEFRAYALDPCRDRPFNVVHHRMCGTTHQLMIALALPTVRAARRANASLASAMLTISQPCCTPRMGGHVTAASFSD